MIRAFPVEPRILINEAIPILKLFEGLAPSFDPTSVQAFQPFSLDSLPIKLRRVVVANALYFLCL